MDYAPPTSCFEILTLSTQQQLSSNLLTTAVNSIRLDLSNDINDLHKTLPFDGTNNHLYVAPIFTAAPINNTTVVSATAAAAAAKLALNSLTVPKLESQNVITSVDSQQSTLEYYSPTPFIFQDRFSNDTQYLSNNIPTNLSLVSQNHLAIDSNITDFSRSFFSSNIQQPNQFFSNYSIPSSLNSHFQTFDYNYSNDYQFSTTDQNSTNAVAAAAAAEFMVGSNVGIYDLAAAAALVSCTNAQSNISQSFFNNVPIASNAGYYYDHLSTSYYNQFEDLNNAPLTQDCNSYLNPIGFYSNNLYSYSYPTNQTLGQYNLHQQQQQNLQQLRLKSSSKNNHLNNLATAQQLFINSAFASPFSHIAAASAMSSAINNSNNNNNSIITSIPSSSSSGQLIYSLNTNEIYQNLTSSNILQPLGVS